MVMIMNEDSYATDDDGDDGDDGDDDDDDDDDDFDDDDDDDDDDDHDDDDDDDDDVAAAAAADDDDDDDVAAAAAADDDNEDEMILHTTLTQIRVQAPKDAECFEFTTIFKSDFLFSASNFEAWESEEPQSALMKYDSIMQTDLVIDDL